MSFSGNSLSLAGKIALSPLVLDVLILSTAPSSRCYDQTHGVISLSARDLRLPYAQAQGISAETHLLEVRVKPDNIFCFNTLQIITVVRRLLDMVMVQWIKPWQMHMVCGRWGSLA